MSSRMYIAGPMRGYYLYNFPAFDAMKVRILRECSLFIGVSPADMDRANGFDPYSLPTDHNWDDWPDGLEPHGTMRACVDAILGCGAIVMLDGWERSLGAVAEYHVARWCGLHVLDQSFTFILHPAFLPVEPVPSRSPDSHEDILTEALRITQGDRQNAYGPPDQDFTRTAAMWSALKGVEFSAREVAMFMIALKLSRETHQCKRDNAVDIAGYARCLSLCQKTDHGVG